MAALRRHALRIRGFFGLEHNILVLAGSGLVQSLGIMLWSGYLPKVLEALGAGGPAIGAFATAGALLGVVFSYAGGLLSDRLGRGRVMVLASLLTASGCLVYMVAPVWWAFFPGVVLTTAAGTFGFMGGLALTGASVRSGRRGISIATRTIIGMVPGMVGPPLGGVLIWWLGLVRGVRVALLGTVLLALAAAWLQRRYYRFAHVPAREKADDPAPVRTAMSPALRSLLVADCLLRFGSGMSATFVVLYVLNVLGATEVEFGFLMSLATLTAAVFVLPVSKLSDRFGPGSRRPVVAATYFFFTAFPLALAAIPSARWLAPVFVVSGLRHVGEPARKALIIDLSEAPDRGRLIGAYHSVRGAVTFPAALAGGILWEWLPSAPFIVGACISSVGLVWFVVSGQGLWGRGRSG
jgi:MFS family permease